MQPGANVVVAAPLEANRRTLYICSLILMPAGLCSLICCWAVYYFGAILSFGAMATGFLQFSHTKTQDAMISCNTVIAARTAFGTLQMMNIAGVVLSFISFLCNAYALYYYATWAWLLGYAYVLFAVVGLIACISIGFAAAFGAYKCIEVNREMLVLIPAPVGVAAGAVAGAYVAMPQQAYGQPGPGYAQPGPGYAQPGPGYAQQPGYAAGPGYSQPGYVKTA